ncbi:MAG TPA: hypothetical protein VN844_19665 [Pyrinomonadaceae bacterium]|nr:hypothetical protein [Pyrinomonadaceae bacterium]
MGQFSKWLLHEDQKEFFEYLFAIVLNTVFLLLIALLLWPLGRAGMAWKLTKAYWVFWTAVIVVSCLLALAQRIFKMDLYSRGDAYIIIALAVSAFLQVGWSAYAAPVIHTSTTGASVVVMIIMYVVGGISAYVAAVIVGAFYMGGLYRLVNSALAILSFAVFSVWPAAGNAMYGWFFSIVERIQFYW